MNVTMRQLQCFVAVARTRSYIEACAIVNLSQPALSIAIKNLEEALGGELLARTTRSVELTPEGLEFLPAATQLLSDWERSLDDVSNLFSLRRGRLIIAAMPTFAGTLLPKVLARFHQLYPAVNVTVHDVVAEEALEMVRSGRVEVGITFDPGAVDDINFEPLFQDRFVTALPPGHSLLQRKRLRWTDLRKQTLISLQKPSSIRQQVEASLLQSGVLLAPVFEAHQLVVVGRMVAEGLGVSVVPEISANQLLEMGVQCREIGPQISRNVGVITHTRRSRSVVTDAMIQVIHDWAEQR